jgi:hypothetical protein
MHKTGQNFKQLPSMILLIGIPIYIFFAIALIALVYIEMEHHNFNVKPVKKLIVLIAR